MLGGGTRYSHTLCPTVRVSAVSRKRCGYFQKLSPK